MQDLHFHFLNLNQENFMDVDSTIVINLVFKIK